MPENVKEKYVAAKGRRKTAIARVRLKSGKGEILVNKIPLSAYFADVYGAAQRVKGILKKASLENKVDLSIIIRGGGKSAQAGAAVHSLARAILKKDKNMKKTLREAGYLTRDPRMKERKKYGLKRARRAPQWQKR